MVEKLKRKPTRWRPHLSALTRLHLALGYSIAEIASEIGCHVDTVRSHIRHERLDRPLSEMDCAALAVSVELGRIMQELQTAEPGSSLQTQLRQQLKAYQKGLDASGTPSRDDGPQDKTLGEMSDDELRAYLADLVPGLATEIAGQPAEPQGSSGAGAVSISGPGTERSAPATPAG
jgi:transposase-like protein